MEKRLKNIHTRLDIISNKKYLAEKYDVENIEKELKELENVLKVKRKKCIENILRLEKYIDKIDDSFLRNIFSMRYSQAMSWNQIAMKIGNNTADSVRMAHTRYLKKER